MHKIIALVKFNDGIAAVLRDKVVEKHYKVGSCIVSTDGTFGSCLYYDRPSPGFFAFAGRKFDLIMEDGETIHCYGQYWDGMKSEARGILGYDCINVTAQDIDSLIGCYVFCGRKISKAKWEQLLSEYNGKTFGYWEYEAILKGKKPWRQDIVDRRVWKNHRRFKKKFLTEKS